MANILESYKQNPSAQNQATAEQIQALQNQNESRQRAFAGIQKTLERSQDRADAQNEAAANRNLAREKIAQESSDTRRFAYMDAKNKDGSAKYSPEEIEAKIAQENEAYLKNNQEKQHYSVQEVLLGGGARLAKKGIDKVKLAYKNYQKNKADKATAEQAYKNNPQGVKKSASIEEMLQNKVKQAQSNSFFNTDSSVAEAIKKAEGNGMLASSFNLLKTPQTPTSPLRTSTLPHERY